MTEKLTIEPCAMGGFHVVVADEVIGSNADCAFSNIDDLTAWLGERYGARKPSHPIKAFLERESVETSELLPLPEMTEIFGDQLRMTAPEPPAIEPEPTPEPAPDVGLEKPLSNADRLQRFIEENGGLNQWVKLSYSQIQDALEFKPPTVKTAIDDLVDNGLIDIHRIKSGPDCGNWFSIAAAQGGKAGPFQSSIEDPPEPVKSEQGDDAVDSVLGALIEISGRLNSNTIEISAGALAKKAEVEIGAVARALTALEKEKLVTLGTSKYNMIIKLVEKSKA